MAELSEQDAAIVMGWFLDAYNRLRASSFRLAVAEPRTDLSCDYLCSDALQMEALLKVQLTRPALSLERRLPDDPSATETISLHAWFKRQEEYGSPGMINGRHDQFLVETIAKKAARLGPSAADLVLLVFFDSLPYAGGDDSIDLEDMHEAMKTEMQVPFKEVWVACQTDWPQGRSDLVWPMRD